MRCELTIGTRDLRLKVASRKSVTEARKIFQVANPETTDQEFNIMLWNKGRNYAFHGTRYPEPKYLGELSEHAQKLSPRCRVLAGSDPSSLGLHFQSVIDLW
jgi:hypothetical protein